jgi:hypothetical protein
MKAIRKSNKAARIPENGMINLGKYIFLIILALATILSAELISPELKRFQNKSPEK